MSNLDWFVLIFTLVSIVTYGIWKTRGAKDLQSYLKGNNDAKWWGIGISIMATQASAITFLSTPGQAYTDGMRFIQFYFGLPLAMIIICVFFVPLYHKLKVYTAYEFLEKRFDRKTRVLARFENPNGGRDFIIRINRAGYWKYSGPNKWYHVFRKKLLKNL